MTPKPMISDAGPPLLRAPPAPTSRPGPMMPASAIIERWRFFRPRLTPESGSIALLEPESKLWEPMPGSLSTV